MKERLVGAAVLVAIAVWLIPWVLDGPERGLEPAPGSLQLPAAEEPMPMRTQTLQLGDAPAAAAPPPTPSATAAAAPEPAAAKASGEEPEAEAAKAHDEPATVVAAAPAAVREPPQREAPAAAPPPKPAAAPAATGDWTVQLGSFGEELNARRMAQRAGTFGYKADVSSYRSGTRTLYRVRVGPQRSRAEADAAASALRAHGIADARVVAAR